jgi:thiosulfate dehydrogenase (quinone) large subunit
MQRQTLAPYTPDDITRTAVTPVSPWRAQGIALLRIIFGLVWAVDAWYKWQPGFINSFTTQITRAQRSQPPGVQSWIAFYGHIASSNPHFFAYLTAVIETVLAIFLLFGLLTNLTCVIGFVWSLAIWSIPEGFGGIFRPGQHTDLGTSLLYALMFALLFVIAAGHYYGVDRWLTPRLGRLGFLASGRPSRAR